jgi:hypothetical protein
MELSGRSPVNVSIQEVNVAICLCLCGELDFGMDAVESSSFSPSMGPEHEGVIHVSEPANWFVGNPFEYLFFKESP